MQQQQEHDSQQRSAAAGPASSPRASATPQLLPVLRQHLQPHPQPQLLPRAPPAILVPRFGASLVGRRVRLGYASRKAALPRGDELEVERVAIQQVCRNCLGPADDVRACPTHITRATRPTSLASYPPLPAWWRVDKRLSYLLLRPLIIETNQHAPLPCMRSSRR